MIKISHFLVLLWPHSQAWHDKTHLTVAKVAGLASWYNAAGPDLAKIKAGNIESYNHWFNNNAEAEVTSQMVFDQIERYNQRNKGRMQRVTSTARLSHRCAPTKRLATGKYASIIWPTARTTSPIFPPLHNIPYDDFNNLYHHANDGIVEVAILDEPQKIAQHMYVIKLSPDHFEADLAREIARIANISRKLGYKLRAENRNITKEEAYVQLGHSASLLKAACNIHP